MNDLERPRERSVFARIVTGIAFFIGGTILLAFLVFGLCLLAFSQASHR